jgi:hypothetical protein
MEYQVHVYDFYHIPDDEDILPTYSPRNDQDLPSYDIALYSDPITEGEAPSYEIALPSDPTTKQNVPCHTYNFCSRTSKSNDIKSNSVNGNSLIANTHANPLGERQTWAHDNTSRKKTADTLHPTERRMGLDGPSEPRPCFLLPFTNCLPQKEQSSSFQSLIIEPYLPDLKRKHSGRKGSTCIECWLIHKKVCR